MKPEIDRLAGRAVRLARSVFRITGPDRVRYLNGQVSNDVTGPLEEESVAACLCNAKGKVEALVWVQARGDTLIVDGELAQRETLHARLEKYLIADECEVEDLTGEVALVHEFMEREGTVRSKRLGPDFPAGWDRWEAARENLGTLRGEISDEEWSLLQIVAKIPRSPEEIDGESFPAELGLDDWAVNFHKGCYLGQEIVSRMRSSGKLRHSLTLIWAENPLSGGVQVSVDGKRGGKTTRPSQSLAQKKQITLAKMVSRREEDAAVENQQVVYELTDAGNFK